MQFNRHAVQRSLSSGASVYESIMGSFSLSHYFSQFQPTRFPLLTAIGMCHLLLVITLNGIFGRVKGQNTTQSRIVKLSLNRNSFQLDRFQLKFLWNTKSMHIFYLLFCHFYVLYRLFLPFYNWTQTVLNLSFQTLAM